MEALNIGSRREVCWDEALIDTAENIRVQMHTPEYRGEVMKWDAPWEGSGAGCLSIVAAEGLLRMYYVGAEMDVNELGKEHIRPGVMCCAESRDGVHFTRSTVNERSFDGLGENNLLPTPDGVTLAVFRDTNPACPSEERYKALCGEFAGKHDSLWLFVSPDGLHFEKKHPLIADGAFDSLNIVFWDDATQQYFLYYRGYHGEQTDGDRPLAWTTPPKIETDEDLEIAAHCLGLIRDIRVRTSKDLVHWSEPQRLQYGACDDLEMYTNNIQKYYRAPHMFIGFPMRYIDRYKDAHNYPLLPDWNHRQELIRIWPRVGTAMTDAAVMTSRDGINFRRTEEAFLTPRADWGFAWYYGDGELCCGMAQTPSAVAGAPDEISLYAGTGYRARNVSLCRWAVRLDGFFSWRCDYTPGRIVTKPLVFAGDTLHINFSTSAFGGVRIRLLDETGEAIPGYDSGVHFGDSVERKVPFEKPLAALAGKTVRMEFTMRDADLYSFKFHETPVIR
ncbi:MAG: hypothetical protein IJ412_06315 [Oscillospiraceae bacterium]|nr:hypothetical protein [Oscillospiraceae bacterium]